LKTHIKSVETNLAAPLPLGHVNLGRPPFHGREPESRPGALGRGGAELARKVVAPDFRDVEVLARVDGAAQVVDRDGLPAVARVRLSAYLFRRQRELARSKGDLGLGHARAAVVVAAPLDKRVMLAG
jgi:hypothetical protein